MNIFKKLFSGNSKQNKIDFNLNLNDYDKIFIEKFNGQHREKKFEMMIHLGDAGKKEHLNLLLYAIINDENLNVKFAALKRLKKFEDEVKIKDFLSKISGIEFREKLEPYFSMALLNFNLITEEELQNIVNAS